ncbi:MAG: DUF1622 domain-containing protein [Planctomycetota bacterium]
MTQPIEHAAAAFSLHDAVMHVLEWAVLFINVACAGVLVWAVLVGLGMFLRQEVAGRRAAPRWPDLRHCVGQYLLFALELLIAADIIETMIRPELSQLAILGGVSLLRILTGYALAQELAHLGGQARPAAHDPSEASRPPSD